MKKFAFLTLLIAAAAILTSAATRSKKNDITRNLDIFNSLYKELQTFYVDSIDADKSINTAITAMLRDIDPYTEYFPAEKQEDFKSMTTGAYAGIGSVIMQRDGNVYISEPTEGAPALEAGLRAGDMIVMIDNDSIAGWTTAKASEHLKGQPGTHVKLLVKRPYAEDSILTFDIVRRKIQMPSVPYYGITRDNVGYIVLTQFTDKSHQEVADALRDLKDDGRMKGLVLDLRDNGGGLLESAVKIVGLFVPRGTEVLRTRGKGLLNEKIYKTTVSPVDTEIPLVVLIDGGTASAAEIVSGALQDMDRAVVAGTRSFGKGLVQSSRQLPYDGLLKVTVAKYYIPSGRLIQAIDYSHRNPDGSVSRIPDSLTTVYTTLHGREVRDGGGITPDVTVSYPKMNRLVYSLLEKNMIMDYATRFAAMTPSIGDPGEFEVTDSIFEDFTAFVNPDKLNYDRVLDNMMKQLREAAEAEGYMNDSVSARLASLDTLLRHDYHHDMARSRKEVERLLSNEIVGRYHLRRGEIINSLKTDEGVDEAAAILNDNERYRNILSPAKKK